MNIENRHHGFMGKKITEVRQPTKWDYAGALIITGIIVAKEASYRGGWAIKEGDVKYGLISAGLTTAIFSLLALLTNSKGKEGKKKKK